MYNRLDITHFQFAQNTRFGCYIHVVGDKAEINCVYMKMKIAALARARS